MTTDITVLLDRSGSMMAIRESTIAGYNRFLTEQRTAPGEAHLTLILFDAMRDHYVNFVPGANLRDRLHYDTVYSGRLSEAPALTGTTFVPRGNTPLIDAMDRMIDETGARLRALPEAYRPDRVMAVIITDGEENASYLTTRAAVMAKVQHQRDVYKWDFVYLGANQDAIAEAVSYGMPTMGAATYTMNNATAAWAAASSNVLRARGDIAFAASFTPEEVASLTDPAGCSDSSVPVP